MEVPGRAGVLGQAEETAPVATVKVLVKHAMGKGEVEVEVQEGATLGDVREAVMKRLGGLQKRLRLVRRAGTVTLVTLSDSEPLGEQREVLVMGADFSSLAAEASPAQAVAPAAPAAPAGPAAPAVATEPVAPAVATEPAAPAVATAPMVPAASAASTTPAASGREAPSAPTEPQVPVALTAPKEPMASMASAASAAPAALPGRAAGPAQAAPAAAPTAAAAEVEDSSLDLDLDFAGALEILERLRKACEGSAVQLALAEKGSQAAHQVDKHPRRGFRTGGAGGIFVEVVQDQIRKMGYNSDRVGIETVYNAIQRHVDKPEIVMAEQRIEQLMRVPTGSWFPLPDGHQPVGLPASAAQQGSGGITEVSVEHAFDRDVKWVHVPVDATGRDVKMALVALGVEQMLTHGQLVLPGAGHHRPLLDHEPIGEHRALLALGVAFARSEASAANPVLTLSQAHRLLESMWCKCLERSWDFKAAPNSAAFRTLVGSEFAAACQDVVTKFGFSGNRSGFSDMFAAVLVHIGDPAVQVLTKHIEELLRVPRGSYFGIIGDSELRLDDVPARPCMEKPREREPSPESAPSEQPSSKGQGPETMPLPEEQAALPSEARPPAAEQADSEPDELETSVVEVAVSYALQGGEIRVLVPATATLDDVREAIAKHEGRPKRDVGRLCQRINNGAQLLSFGNTEALGSRRSFLLLEMSADTGVRVGPELAKTHRYVDKILSRVQSASFRSALSSESPSNKTSFQKHRAALVTKTFADICLEFGLRDDYDGFKQLTSSIMAHRGDPAVRAKTDKIEAILHFSSGEMFGNGSKPSPVAERGKLSEPTGAAAAPSPDVEEVLALLDQMQQACSQLEFKRAIAEARRGTIGAFRAKRGAIWLKTFGGIVADAGYSLNHEGFNRMHRNIALYVEDPRVAHKVSDIEDSLHLAHGEMLAAVLGGEGQLHREGQAHRDERARPAKPARARAG